LPFSLRLAIESWAYAWGAAFHGTFLYRGLLDHAADYGARVSNASGLQDVFQLGEVRCSRWLL
jgi:hypothetical protein